MDDSKFDALTKSLSRVSSRRAALRASVGALIASVTVTHAADAAVCRPTGSICRKDADCCDGTCGAADATGRRRCGCGPDCTNDCCFGVCCEHLTHCDHQTRQCEWSCFIAGTRIAMADGTSRPIELVGFGDLVLGEHGAVSRVIGVETPLLGSRMLYGLNGSEPFVTAEHPFMTAAGWKSIDPNATYAEQPNLPVHHLQVGDTLVELAELRVPAVVGGMLEPAGIQTRRVAVSSIIPTTAAPSTQLYNLLLDGNHTYFANDLLVHNKA